jgi:hypothetical protein
VALAMPGTKAGKTAMPDAFRKFLRLKADIFVDLDLLMYRENTNPVMK